MWCTDTLHFPSLCPRSSHRHASRNIQTNGHVFSLRVRCLSIMWLLQTITRITLFMRIITVHLCYISFKVVPVSNYTFYRQLWWCWESSWKACYESIFSSAVAFLMMSGASPKHSSISAGREQVKISWRQVRRVLWILQCCYIVLC